jgi:hypothetical protein
MPQHKIFKKVKTQATTFYNSTCDVDVGKCQVRKGPSRRRVWGFVSQFTLSKAATRGGIALRAAP